MANYLGSYVYKTNAYVQAEVDSGPVSRTLKSAAARGTQFKDYNSKLRGKAIRPDIVPQPPYP